MIARRYIRVLVPYSKTYYCIEGMKTYGLAYDRRNLFEKEELIDFSSPTVTGIKDIVVGGPTAPPLKSVADLAGQQVWRHAILEGKRFSM